MLMIVWIKLRRKNDGHHLRYRSDGSFSVYPSFPRQRHAWVLLGSRHRCGLNLRKNCGALHESGKSCTKGCVLEAIRRLEMDFERIDDVRRVVGCLGSEGHHDCGLTVFSCPTLDSIFQ